MFRKFINPVFIFVLFQLSWAAFLSLWIIWYIRNELTIAELAGRLAVRTPGGSVLILIGGSVLMALLLAGSTVLFVYLMREFRVNVMQRDFVSTITHELKTPLASIQLYLETIWLRNPPPEDQREFVAQMLKEGRRLSRLIDNLLVVSRIRQRRMLLDLAARDLGRFVDHWFEELKADHWVEDESLRVKSQPGLNVLLDEKYMDIVLSNLVNNAYKYSGGAFQLNVEVRRRRRWAVLVVQDGGVGVDPRELRKIFKMFYRAPATQDLGAQGTGLGLFIVRSVVRGMGGRVKASSKGGGKGLTVSVWLPLLKGRRDAAR